MRTRATSIRFQISSFKFFVALTLALVALAPSRAAADFIYAGASGSLTASVTFAQSGTNFILTLSNTTSADALAQADILTGVFFTLAGNPVMTRISAVVPAGSTVLFGAGLGDGSGTDPGGVVGGEWAYNPSLNNAPHGAQQGIASSGFSSGAEFDATQLFPGTDLSPPPSPDGINYGITSAGDNPLTGTSAVTGSKPLIQYSVVFTLGLPTNYVLTANSISDVSFQYGTALNEPNYPGTLVPEPGSITLAVAGIVLLALLGRKRR